LYGAPEAVFPNAEIGFDSVIETALQRNSRLFILTSSEAGLSSYGLRVRLRY
jgi:hypothetical protein